MRRLPPLVPPRLRASHAEVYTAALRGRRGSVLGMGLDAVAMPIRRWSAAANASDHSVLDSCAGSTLDIGCGPGRLSMALAERGSVALGIDMVPEAVAMARARGASAVLRDVFADVPEEGSWDTALLADGNIGIGGDPVSLLRRAGQLVHPRGRVVVDLARPGEGFVTRTLRLRVGGLVSEPFPWSVVAPEALGGLSGAAGLRVGSVRVVGQRWIAELHVRRSRCA